MSVPVLSRRQVEVKEKIMQYLTDKVKKSQAELDAGRVPEEVYDESFIPQFKKGYCSGIASVWLVSKWLQTQPKERDVEKDDYEWFQRVIDIALRYNGLGSLSRDDEIELKRFVYHIQFLQKVTKYLTEVKAGPRGDSVPVFQGDLDKVFQDTVGRGEGDQREVRKLNREYSIASQFTLEQLEVLLASNDVIHNRRLIRISSHNHATALFKDVEVDEDGEKHTYYYFFDPNSPIGQVRTESVSELAQMIFDANYYDYDVSSPLGFKILSFDKRRQNYPRQSDVLTGIGTYLDSQPEDNYANGYTGLMMASRIGCSGSVKHLLRHSRVINAKSKDGWSAFMLAARYGYPDVIREFLIRGGAELVHSKGKNDWTALMYAARYGYLEAAEELIRKGGAKLVMAKARGGWTARRLAVKYGHPEVAEVIARAERGYADKNSEKLDRLIGAIKDDDFYSFDKVLSDDPEIDLNMRRGGWTVLMHAVEYDSYGIIESLLEKGADPTLLNIPGMSALMIAAHKGDRRAVRAFRRMNVPLDEPRSKFEGWTALMYAAIDDHVGVVEELLDGEADVNAVTESNWSALMLAARFGRVGVVKTLLARGADLSIEDDQDRDALAIAKEYGHKAVIEELEHKMRRAEAVVSKPTRPSLPKPKRTIAPKPKRRVSRAKKTPHVIEETPRKKDYGKILIEAKKRSELRRKRSEARRKREASDKISVFKNVSGLLFGALAIAGGVLLGMTFVTNPIAIGAGALLGFAGLGFVINSAKNLIVKAIGRSETVPEDYDEDELSSEEDLEVDTSHRVDRRLRMYDSGRRKEISEEFDLGGEMLYEEDLDLVGDELDEDLESVEKEADRTTFTRGN